MIIEGARRAETASGVELFADAAGAISANGAPRSRPANIIPR